MISVRTKLYFSMENLILQQFFVFTFPEAAPIIELHTKRLVM